MSIKAISWVWEQSSADGTDRLVFLALADFADGYGEAWPHQDLLADKCRISRRTVQRAIENLVQSGELQVLRTGRGNRYKLPMRQSDVIRQSDASDASDCHLPSDTGDASDASLLSLSMNRQEPSMNQNRVDASLGKPKPNTTWVRPTNFVEDLDQLPERQVAEPDDEAKAEALARIKAMRGGPT